MSRDHSNIPDFSCEIDKSEQYLNYIHEVFSALKRRNEADELVLVDFEANTFLWMLCDSMEVLRNIKKALYPGN